MVRSFVRSVSFLAPPLFAAVIACGASDGDSCDPFRFEKHCSGNGVTLCVHEDCTGSHSSSCKAGDFVRTSLCSGDSVCVNQGFPECVPKGTRFGCNVGAPIPGAFLGSLGEVPARPGMVVSDLNKDGLPDIVMDDGTIDLAKSGGGFASRGNTW